MAQIPKQSEEVQEHQRPGQNIRPSPSTTATTANQLHRNQQIKSQPTKEPTKTKTDPVKLSETNRFSRSSTQRHSKTLIAYPLEIQKESPKSQIPGPPQPSTRFAKKCRAEFQTLLETIKQEYHDDIKSLNEDEKYVDLFIKIGNEDLKRPLHKCIIAARAFKLYCALKEFRTSISTSEGDIIIADLQASTLKPQSSESLVKADNRSTCSELEDQLIDSASAERRRQSLEALEILTCELPENLINSEYLLSLARRAYLDVDISEDETNIHLIILNWLKVNRPESIKMTHARRSIDHRESFRTIQPDFEQLSISGSTSPPISTNELSTSDLQKNMEDVTGGDVSNSCSVRDDGQAVTSLTRTETFEMLAKTTLDIDTGEVNKEDQTLDEEDKDRSEVSVNTSESSEPYTPVTRTGLKPKKFTPIVGMKSNRSSKASSSSKKAVIEGRDDSRETSKKTGASTTNTPNISKRSNQATGNASDPTGSALTSTPQSMSKRCSSISTKTTPSQVKQTITTKAHPISLERSQSPATNPSKAHTKNFIAANKKLISQIEKKIASSSNHQTANQSQANDNSDDDVSDASLIAFTEALSTDSLAAQIDKFALVSISKLADALSQMFIGEILTDMVVLARDNKEINAHKCILAARSAYLNDQITKLSLPSMTSDLPSSSKQLIKVDLTEYSYAAVYFSMMHIYSGIVKVPEDLEVEELAKISHLLHVGTLRQVCMHHLRMNYCHYFHKPCNACCLGVLRTLPLAWRYDLTELYSKCLQWIGTHFAQVFCLEEFSNLKPRDLIEECFKETCSQLTPDNVIQRTIECQKLLKSLPRVKWTETIICLVGRQLEDFCHYVADNYEKILQSESFMNLGKSCWECEVLEENLLAAMNHLKPDSGCKTLIQLDKIECSIETYCDEPRPVSETFANLISKMRKYCERYLLKDAAAVVHCSSWRMMNPSLQKKIKDQALIASDFDEPSKHLSSKPKLPSMSRQQQQRSSSKSSPSPQPVNSGSDTKSPSNRSTPDSRLKSPNTTYLPPPKTKPAAARHVKVLK
jgi:hypothetical protein